MEEPTDKIYSEREASRILGLSYDTVRSLRRRGELSHFRPGKRVLYSPEHLAEFLKRHEQRAVVVAV